MSKINKSVGCGNCGEPAMDPRTGVCAECGYRDPAIATKSINSKDSSSN